MIVQRIKMRVKPGLTKEWIAVLRTNHAQSEYPDNSRCNPEAGFSTLEEPRPVIPALGQRHRRHIIDSSRPVKQCTLRHAHGPVKFAEPFNPKGVTSSLVVIVIVIRHRHRFREQQESQATGPFRAKIGVQ